MHRQVTARIDLTAEAVSPALEKLWRAFDASGGHGFFQTWHWAGTMLRVLPSHMSSQILVARRASQPVGLAFFTSRRSRHASFVPMRVAWLNATGDSAFDCVTIEHNGFASSGTEESTLVSALAAAFEDGSLNADELNLPGLESPLLETRRSLVSIRRSPAYRTDLNMVRAKGDIATLLSANARQHLNRSIRDCRSIGPLSLEAARDASAAQSYFTGLKEFHTASWKHRSRRHAFDEPFFEIFHRKLIAECAPVGAVDLLRVSAGDTVLGYLYNFRRNGVIYSYQSGFDHRLSHLRPGYICHALAIDHYAHAGDRTYDFLAGFHQLKRSFFTEEYEMRWYRLRRPKLLFRAEALAKKMIDGMRSKAVRT